MTPFQVAVAPDAVAALARWSKIWILSVAVGLAGPVAFSPPPFRTHGGCHERRF